MGELPWGKLNSSNIKEGGTFRRAGEEELDVLKAKGLSDPEIEIREKTEALEKKELAFLENILNELNWRATDALESAKAQEMIGKKLPPGFRYPNLKKYLQTLSAQETRRTSGRKIN